MSYYCLGYTNITPIHIIFIIHKYNIKPIIINIQEVGKVDTLNGIAAALNARDFIVYEGSDGTKKPNNIDTDVKKLTRKSEKSAPSKEQLVLDAITNLNEKIIRKIKKVYK